MVFISEKPTNLGSIYVVGSGQKTTTKVLPSLAKMNWYLATRMVSLSDQSITLHQGDFHSLLSVETFAGNCSVSRRCATVRTSQRVTSCDVRNVSGMFV